MRALTPRACSPLACDERGLVFVEYLLALVLLCVGACLAISACAVLLVRLFAFQQAVLLLPFP